MVNESKVSVEAFPAVSVTVISNPPLLTPAVQFLPLIGVIARVFDPDMMLVSREVASPPKDAVPASSLVSTKLKDDVPAALTENGLPLGET